MGRKSLNGRIDARYLLKETPDSNYLQRTEWNVRDSDATAIFTLSENLDGGSKRTAEFAKRLGKPWLHMRPRVDPKYLARFLTGKQVKVLNVAGERESSALGIAAFVRATLDTALVVDAER